MYNLNMIKKILSLFAWYGVFAILTAYFLSVFEYIEVSSPIYLLLNLTGSLGIFLDSLMDKDYQPAVLNIVWFLIALVGILNVLVA